MSDNESATFEDVVADLNHAIQRLYKAKAVETKQELVNNVYPLMLSMMEATHARLLESEEMVAGILGETESIIQPELADELGDALDAGRALAMAVTSVLTDDVTKQRLVVMAKAFLEKYDGAYESLHNVALEDIDTEEYDEEEDEAEKPELSLVESEDVEEKE